MQKDMKNPFYPVAEFPDFPAMTPEAADEALPKLLADAKASVAALEDVDAPAYRTAYLLAPALFFKDTLAAFLGVEITDEGNQ